MDELQGPSGNASESYYFLLCLDIFDPILSQRENRMCLPVLSFFALKIVYANTDDNAARR